MTSTQLLLVCGLIYMAPHVDRDSGMIVGLLFVLASCVLGILQ